MNNEMAVAILVATYFFTAVPLMGRIMVLGKTSKTYWVGYNYDKCLERGFMLHLSIAALCLIWWAIKTVEI